MWERLDWESNLTPFHAQADLVTNEPHRLGRGLQFLVITVATSQPSESLSRRLQILAGISEEVSSTFQPVNVFLQPLLM